MAASENVERVYPTRSELETESQTNVPCPVAGCSKIFRQPSALRFHMVKLHKLILNESDARLAQHLKPQTKKQYEFYCPESGCKFSAHKQKFFQSYKKLKQHFMRLHANRSFVCFMCGESFGLSYDMKHHIIRCHRKPWCESCRLCMGSWEMLARHISETGHEGLRKEGLEDHVNNAANRHSGETSGTASANECADSFGVDQSATVSEKTVIHESSFDVETEMLKNGEQHSVEIFDPIIVVPSTDLKEIVCADIMSTDRPLLSLARNEDNAEQSNRKTIVSQSKDNGRLPRKKKSSAKSKQDKKLRTILPASNLIVFPVQVGTVFFCTMPINPSMSINPSKPSLERLAPRQSSTVLELDPPVTSDCLVTHGCTRDMLAQDLKSHETARESVSTSTQTRSRRIKVAETQTTEGYVLKKTLGVHNNAQLARQSCGSQVSPRARLKRLNVQSIQTQTATRSLARKHKPSNTSMQHTNQDAVSSVIPTIPSSSASSSSTNIWPDFVHNETQTMALLQQLEASLAESSSTQTLESYLFDNFPNENGINASNNETSSNPCSAVNMLQDSVYATMTAADDGSNLFNSVALPIAEQPPPPPKQCTTTGNMNESEEYGLFSSEFPSVTESDRNTRNFLDDMFVHEFPSSSAAASCRDDIFAEEKTNFSAETQTMQQHPNSSFTDFLTAASQTTDFSDLMSTNTETQTVDDDFFTQFWTHMETQTTDDFLTEFGFSDTETQTTWAFRDDVRHPLDAPRIPPPPPLPHSHEPQGAVLLDMETQTCFQ